MIPRACATPSSSADAASRRPLPAVRAAALSLALALAAASGHAQPLPACPGDVCPGLGNAFYLPTYDALDTFTGGKVFFKSRELGKCALYKAGGPARRDFEYSESTDSFFHLVSSETDLSGSYDSLQLSFDMTLSTTTGYSVATSQRIQSLALDITYVTGVVNFQQNGTCWAAANLDPAFLAAFAALPTTLADPSSSTSWTPYLSFLQAWGSHVMVEQSLGSRFQQWESVLDTSKVTQATLQAKACAEVEGTTAGGGWSVDGCAAYSSEEKEEALETTTKEKQYVLGGSEAARKGLLKGVTSQALEAFIDSADQADEAVEHGWEPIWSLLAGLYQPACTAKGSAGCDLYQRALNLQAAYEGWIAVGCPYVEARGRAVQVMQVAGTDALTGIRTYGCWTKKEGCAGESADCHLSGGACYCYGNGCIVRDSKETVGDPFAPAGYRDKIQTSKTGSFDKGVNRSCHYDAGAAQCKCSGGKLVGLADRYLWLQ